MRLYRCIAQVYYILILTLHCIEKVHDNAVDAIATLGKSSKMCFVFGQLDKISRLPLTEYNTFW